MTKDHIQFFFEGDDYYEALWNDLRSAKSTIYLQVYLLADDRIGAQLAAILKARALEGLDVRLTVDGIGSMELPETYLAALQSVGVRIKVYHPLKLLTVFQRTLFRRDHRKVILIDGTIGYLGGFNLHEKSSKKYFAEQRWRDTQVRITGPWVQTLTKYVHQAFGFFLNLPRAFRPHIHPNVILATLGPRAGNPIRRLFHRYIRKTKKALTITTAYFVPDLRTLFLLTRAAKRGVAVTIITARDVIDVPLVNRANRWLLAFLIRRGVVIYCFKGRMLHTKTAHFDDLLGTVGSSNVNYRSFFWDKEINAFFRNPRWVHELAEQTQRDLTECRRLGLEELDNVSLWQRLLDGIIYLIKSFF
jgi:cardiolipin synthase